MGHYPELLTRIPFNFPGHVYRSPMPFSHYDPTNQVWEEYLAQQISDIFVLAENIELPRVDGVDMLSFYRSYGLEAYHFPIPDYQVPVERKDLEIAMAALEIKARAGKNVAVHCLAGIGRTGLFLGCLGKRHLALGGRQAVEWIRQIIPGSLENLLQVNYVFDF